MLLETLTLENFRNLKGNPPSFEKGINVLYGNNAAGKTNTLEAIYLFATGKSFRTRNEKDFISHGKDFARARIDFTDLYGKRYMSVSYLAQGNKAAKAMYVEERVSDRVSEFLGNFRAVLFTPDHLELVKGAPEERRRLVDMALCQIQPRFVKSLNEYVKVLAQRNNYLKSLKMKGQTADADYLDVLNKMLAQSGAVITKQRGIFCRKLSQSAGEMYSRLSSEKEMLFARYMSRACMSGDFTDEKAICDALYQMYKRDTQRDIELCKTSHGPHRDELMIYVAKKQNEGNIESAAFENEDDERLCEYAARTFGSQGQQRSAVLAIKLAEGEIIKEKCGEYPVFLLDDLFSELDTARRERLCSMLNQRQCIITACDKSSIPVNEDISIVNVKDGCFSETK